MAGDSPSDEPLKLTEFCTRIGVGEREVRYALARGIVPQGMKRSPGRGNHRQFDPRQSFWLAIVLRLKAAGVKTPLAGKIAEWAQSVEETAVALGLDSQLSPFSGNWRAADAWLLEVGDGKLVRILSDASSHRKGRFKATDWMRMSKPQFPNPARGTSWAKVEKNARPIVTIRVDLSELARLLLGERTVSQGTSASERRISSASE